MLVIVGVGCAAVGAAVMLLVVRGDLAQAVWERQHAERAEQKARQLLAASTRLTRPHQTPPARRVAVAVRVGQVWQDLRDYARREPEHEGWSEGELNAAFAAEPVVSRAGWPLRRRRHRRTAAAVVPSPAELAAWLDAHPDPDRVERITVVAR